ncbi:MAG: rRNA maturation RNase YbeY [Candidatus Limnocylindrales bacterium]
MARPKRVEPTVRAVYLRPWRIDISRSPAAPSLVSAGTLARTAADALTAAGAPSPASIALILSDDRELARLNDQHMDNHGPTDVLSFPLLPPSAFPPHAGKSHDQSVRRPVEPPYQRPARQRQHLGDIVISVERAIAQADQGRGGQTGDVTWSSVDELRLLVVHGVLHISGWDHADPVERDAMRALEREVMGRV